VKKILIKNNSALAGVIEALLLVGLVAVILSTIQLVYIPEIMKQKESSHLDEVENQFSHIKSVIDTQSMMGVMQSDQAIAYSPMFSPIKLGTKRLPYFVTSDTYGELQIIDNEDTNSEIDILPSVGDSKYLDGIPLTSIQYTFYSMYQGYNTKYIYEGSGVILNQTGSESYSGETMRVNPAMKIENYSNNIKIYYSIPVLFCQPGKSNLYGLDLSYIRTNYTNHVTHSDTSITHIRIYSEHLDAWYQSLVDNRIGILWEYDENGYINVEYKESVSPNYIEITPGTKNINVDFTILEIGIQTGSGTVIS